METSGQKHKDTNLPFLFKYYFAKRRRRRERGERSKMRLDWELEQELEGRQKSGRDLLSRREDGTLTEVF